jgi:hypothetical protein
MDKQIMISATSEENCWRCKYFDLRNPKDLSGVCKHPEAMPISILYADDNCTLFKKRLTQTGH